MAKSLEKQLVDACEVGNLDLIKDLISRGVNIHAWNDTALRWAANDGHLEIVKCLIENGADIHTDSLCGAAQHGHLNIVKYLIQNSVNIYYVERALYWASEFNHKNIVKYLEGVILKEKRKKVWKTI